MKRCMKCGVDIRGKAKKGKSGCFTGRKNRVNIALSQTRKKTSLHKILRYTLGNSYTIHMQVTYCSIKINLTLVMYI